nr:glycoside hydrolase family protein [Caballeronia sp. NK8]
MTSNIQIRFRTMALAAAASVLLAACGGGGGGGGDTASSANATRSGSASASAVSVPATDTPASDTGTTKITTSPPAANSTATVPASGASSPAASAPDPASNTGSSPTPPQSVRPFYGVNGHNNEGGAYDISSTALQLSQLQDLGAKLYRNEVYSQGTANKLAGIAQTMAAGGVTVYPVMLMNIDIFNNETEGYNAGFALGQQTATSRHYPYYEVTNEMEAELLIGNVDGVYPQQFDIAKFRKLRGVIRGMIAGIRSVDASGKIIMGGGTWLHYGFHQMLAAGMEPDGSIGHPVVDWDITAWHWYSEQGDITNACGGTGCHNVLAALKALGKPIWINEFGVRPNYGTDQQIAAYLVGNTMMAQFVALASTYDIESIQSYELYDDPVGGEGPFGLLKNDGFTQKPAYTAYKNFVAAHPM